MNIVSRIILDVILFILVFTAPWWLTLPVVVVGIFLVRDFYESVLFAILLDGFHGVPGTSFFGLNLFFTAIISGAFIFITLIKPRLTFYGR